MKLTDPKTVRRLLQETGFAFKKQLGQNFLIDPSVCPAMAEAAVADCANVLEIGPGAGVLTAELAARARRVAAIEVDTALRPVLEKTIGAFANTEIIYGDCMQLDLHALIAERFGGGPVAVCANLPYYITSPVLMRLLEERLPIVSITVMVQKEAAERLCAPVSSRAAGAVTVAVAYRASAERLFDVPKESFMPAPKVDSTVIRLSVLPEPPVAVTDEAFFFRLVRTAFMQRRKTFANAAANLPGITKDTLRAALQAADLSENIRAEALTMQDWAFIANYITKEQ